MVSLGSSFSLSSLAGFLGGFLSIPFFLNFYIVSVYCNLIGIVVIGIFLLVKVTQLQSSFNGFSMHDWRRLSNDHKDSVQQILLCCGYKQGDGVAYIGQSHDHVSGAPIHNQCDASIASLQVGCFEAGQKVINKAAVDIAFFFTGGLILCFLALFAARYANERKGLMERGFKPAPQREALLKSGSAVRRAFV